MLYPDYGKKGLADTQWTEYGPNMDLNFPFIVSLFNLISFRWLVRTAYRAIIQGCKSRDNFIL